MLVNCCEFSANHRIAGTAFPAKQPGPVSLLRQCRTAPARLHCLSALAARWLLRDLSARLPTRYHFPTAPQQTSVCKIDLRARRSLILLRLLGDRVCFIRVLKRLIYVEPPPPDVTVPL